MANPGQTRFTQWYLSSQEELQFAILNTSQLQLLQNDLSLVADQLVNQEFLPNDPMTYAMQRGHLQGQMQTYQFIIDRSNASSEILKRAAETEAASQQKP